MRVAGVLGTSDNSGGSKVILRYLAALRESGMDLGTCYCPDRQESLADNAVLAGRSLGLVVVPCRGIDRWIPLAAARRTAKALREAKVSTLVASNVQNALRYCVWVKLFYPRLTILAVANNAVGFDGSRLFHPAKLRVYRLLLNNFVEHVVFVSHALRASIAPGPAGRLSVTVIENSVDMTEFSQVGPASEDRYQLLDELGLDRGSSVVLYCARISAQKDILTFVRVASQVSRSQSDVHFVLAGEAQAIEDMHYLDLVRSELDRLGASDRVHLLGWRSDVKALLCACDVYLSTARWEGLPLGILEAMASGRPVVTTDFASAREVVTHEVTGFVEGLGDVAQLSERIVSLLGDHRLRAEMGLRGRAVAESRFDSSEASRRFVKVVKAAGAA